MMGKGMMVKLTGGEGEGGKEAVLGIRDILVRILIHGPYLWLMDPDPRIRIQLRIRLLYQWL